MFLRQLCITFVFLLACYPVQSATLHTIIVADTDDVIIGAEKDLEYVEKLASNISRYTGLRKQTTVIRIEGALVDKPNHRGNGYEQVKSAIENLYVAHDDVVFFYYSGHGLASEHSQWPRLAVQGVRTTRDRQLESTEIKETLWNKSPRLLLFIVDACNNSSLPSFGRQKSIAYNNPDAYKKLFLEYKGFLLASSSKKGEPSAGTKAGGLFTKDFRRKLEKALASDNPSWENIVAQMHNRPLVVGDFRQHPQFDASYLTSIQVGESSTAEQSEPLVRANNFICQDGEKAYFMKAGKKCCFLSHESEQEMCFNR